MNEAIDLEIRVVTKPLGNNTFRLQFTLNSAPGRQGFTHHEIEGRPLRGNPENFSAWLGEKFAALDQQIRLDDSGPDPADDDVILEELAKIGRELYVDLFPPALRQAYTTFRETTETILLVSDEPWIPWELVKPYDPAYGEDDFLCCRFALTRWLTGENSPAADLGALKLGAARVACIEGSGVARVGEEWRLLKELAGDHSGVEAVHLSDASHADIDELLRLGGCGILHFIGHGAFNEEDPASSHFVLADGRALLPRDLLGAIEERIRQDRPLVFFNSCESGRQGFGLSQLAGWTSRWVRDCSCGAFLGSLWKVTDQDALTFARAFYGSLADGVPLGQAARDARRSVRRELPGSTAWLAYVVYGHPQTRLRLGLGPTPLRIPAPQWRPEVSPPGALLQAEYRIVPFHGREQEFTDLLTWAADGSPVQVRLYTGAGGMGKTRLALEVCQHLREEGWETGFLAPDPSCTPETLWQNLRARDKPIALVVDYAESQHEILVPLCRELYRAHDGRCRLMLLARDALDWWEQLKREGDGVGDLLSGPASRWFSLRPLAMTSEERLASYRRATAAFADRLGLPKPEEAPQDLMDPIYKRVLLLHMRALTDLEGVPVKNKDGLLDHILRRERRFWERLARQRQVPETLVSGIGRAMAAICLGGGALNEGHAVKILGALHSFNDQPRSTLVAVARLLHDTYPGEEWIEPILPDLLSEHLQFRELQEDPEELLNMLAGPAPPTDASP